MADTKTIPMLAAFVAAQSAMGKAIKDSANPAFRSKYADLGSVMDACMPALHENGFCVYQPVTEVEGARYVETIIAHVSGESLSCKIPLIVAKNDMQGFGSAVTYARRYGLMTMAGIAPEDDDGNAAAKSPPAAEQPKPRPPAEPNAVDAACASLGNADSIDKLKAIWDGLPVSVQGNQMVIAAKDKAKARLTKPAQDDLGVDAIPY